MFSHWGDVDTLKEELFQVGVAFVPREGSPERVRHLMTRSYGARVHGRRIMSYSTYLDSD